MDTKSNNQRKEENILSAKKVRTISDLAAESHRSRNQLNTSKTADEETLEAHHGECRDNAIHRPAST